MHVRFWRPTFVPSGSGWLTPPCAADATSRMSCWWRSPSTSTRRSPHGLTELGCHDLGESRPQTLWQKAESLPAASVRWHLIGHLQRNKIRRTLPLVTLLHSVDSLRLLDALQEEAKRREIRVPVLLEVNVSGDTDKTGFDIDELTELPARWPNWPQLDACGLMAMSGLDSDKETAREEFSRLRELARQTAAAMPGGRRVAAPVDGHEPRLRSGD